jgi:uncharacterized protein
MPEHSMLDAGPFSVWLDETRTAHRRHEGPSVPCGSCTACCTSSQFVHIAPDEVESLAHIPASVLFPAPTMPSGHVLMGYDDHGCCPMLLDGVCSIYEHRPRTCRVYDCRVLAAAEVELGDPTKQAIDEQVARWRFTYPSPSDCVAHDAVVSAARYLDDHQRDLPSVPVSLGPTQRAVLAVAIHHTFVAAIHEPGIPPSTGPTVDDVDASIRTARSANR